MECIWYVHICTEHLVCSVWLDVWLVACVVRMVIIGNKTHTYSKLDQAVKPKLLNLWWAQCTPCARALLLPSRHVSATNSNGTGFWPSLHNRVIHQEQFRHEYLKCTNRNRRINSHTNKKGDKLKHYTIEHTVTQVNGEICVHSIVRISTRNKTQLCYAPTYLEFCTHIQIVFALPIGNTNSRCLIGMTNYRLIVQIFTFGKTILNHDQYPGQRVMRMRGVGQGGENYTPVGLVVHKLHNNGFVNGSGALLCE